MLLHLRELQVQRWLECRVWEVCVYLPFIGSMYHKLPNSRLCGASAFPDPWTADLSKSLADPPAEVQSYLHGCILLTHSGEQRFDALHRCAVELTFRPFSNPNPLEEELRQPREVLLIPWRGADLTPGVPGWFTRGVSQLLCSFICHRGMMVPATSVFHRRVAIRNIGNTLWYMEMKDAGLIQSFICCFSLLLLVKLLNTLLTVLSEALPYVLSLEE